MTMQRLIANAVALLIVIGLFWSAYQTYRLKSEYRALVEDVNAANTASLPVPTVKQRQ